MNFIDTKNGGTFVGTVREVQRKTSNYGKERLLLIGEWDGQRGDTLDVPATLERDLNDLGIIGEDAGGMWADASRKLAVERNGSGTATRWHVSEGNGAVPSHPAPARPASPRPQTQRPAAAQRPAGVATPVVESPEVIRRRIDATYQSCLLRAWDAWKVMGTSGLEVDSSTIQAAAATLFIQEQRLNLALLPDPQAAPPITSKQVSGLKELRETARRLGFSDDEFTEMVSEYGNPAKLTRDEADKAILGVANELVRVEKEKALAAAPAPAIDDEIPF